MYLGIYLYSELICTINEEEEEQISEEDDEDATKRRKCYGCYISEQTHTHIYFFLQERFLGVV